MEPRFGHDFSRVRLHSDGEAVASARSLGVPAYSMGTDVVLGEDALAFGSARSRRLIAHELAHVVQSERGGPPTSVAAAEEDAERAGELAAAGGHAHLGTAVPSAWPMRAPPTLAPPPLAPDVGWKPREMTERWYTLDGFDTKKAELTERHMGIVDTVVKDLARDPLMGGFITVIGYADAVGTDPDNKVLGQQRADAVRATLVDKGVSPNDVRAYSLGEEIPAVETSKAEAKNRRVVIVVRRRRMRFGLTPTAPSPTIGGPRKQEGVEAKQTGQEQRVTVPEKSEAEKAVERRKEFERRISELAEDKGATKGTLFDEAVKYLSEKGGPDLANEVADIAQRMGFDRKKAREIVEKGIEKGLEAGLKEALKALLTAIAGTPSERPASETGPPVFEQKTPPGISVPLPFPGDQPAPANVYNPTLTVTDRLSPSMTKTVYKPGEFITFSFTTPKSFGQVRTVVEIVPSGGGAAVRRVGITGRRSGSESLRVPDTPGSYVLQVRLADEEPHPSGARRFSVRALDAVEKKKQ
jgi:outer membrane protein OmpA-like peptidoglycan-associated protein